MLLQLAPYGTTEAVSEQYGQARATRPSGYGRQNYAVRTTAYINNGMNY